MAITEEKEPTPELATLVLSVPSRTYWGAEGSRYLQGSSSTSQRRRL
jgi:hypothetical protein